MYVYTLFTKLYLYYMILICVLNCSNWMKKPSRPLPSTLSPHTSVQAKPPDSWPRAEKNNPCSRFSLFRRLVTVS